MSTEKIQQLIARACFGPEGAALPEDGIDPEDLAALDPKRLRLYRRLVRHNVVNVIGLMLPATKKRMDAAVFDATVDAFMAEVGPRTSHLRDVPSEFVAFAAPRWRADARLPRWIADHAELELHDFTIGVAPRAGEPPPLVDVDAEKPLVFKPPHALVRLSFAVNGLAEDAEPEERPVVILVYRDEQHGSRFLELTPLAGAILERLFAGKPLGEAMTSACAALGFALDENVLGGAARLLADLGERGVLLGAREQGLTPLDPY